MWAEKDRMKAGDVIRNSLSGEIATVGSVYLVMGTWVEAIGILHSTNNHKYFTIIEDDYWDVLE